MASKTPIQISGFSGSGSAAALSTVAFTTTPTVGSIIILACTITGSTVFTPPAGFSAPNTLNSGSTFSSYFGWKKSDGTETGALTVSFGEGGHAGHIVAIEYPGTALAASPFDVSAVNTDNIGTPATSQSSGSATNTVADALAIVMIGSNVGSTISAGRAYTNGFTEDHEVDVGSGSRGCVLIASKDVSTIASQSTTFSTTGTGDEMWGAMLVFKGVAATAGALPGSLALMGVGI